MRARAFETKLGKLPMLVYSNNLQKSFFRVLKHVFCFVEWQQQLFVLFLVFGFCIKSDGCTGRLCQLNMKRRKYYNKVKWMDFVADSESEDDEERRFSVF